MENQSKRAIKGVFWSGVESFSNLGVQFVISVILARLLTPEDFGVLALTSIFIIILQTINEYGLNAALMNKLDRDDLDYSSVFIFNIFLGFIFYIILFLFAPFIAVFFDQPILKSLIRVVGLNLVINSFIVVQQTIYTIQINFKTQAKVSFIAVIVSGLIGIYFAYKGLGVWSLVIQVLLSSFINVVLLWFYSKWKPKKLKFSLIRIKSLMKFAYKLILARLIDVIFQQGYSLVIGKFYSVAQLGYFNRAKGLQQLSSGNITSVIQRVSVPLLCEQKNNHEKLANTLLKFIINAAFVIYPLLIGLLVLAKPLIIILLTDKWLPSVWILQILCPVGMFYVVNSFNTNVFNATGRTDWALKVELIKKFFYIFILIVAINISFTALVISQPLIALIELFITTHYTKKQIGLTLFQQLKALKGVIFSALIMGVSILLISNIFTDNLQKLLIGVLSGVLIYSVLVYSFNVNNTRNILLNYLRTK